jgi:hypothetical protein
MVNNITYKPSKKLGRAACRFHKYRNSNSIKCAHEFHFNLYKCFNLEKSIEYIDPYIHRSYYIKIRSLQIGINAE